MYILSIAGDCCGSDLKIAVLDISPTENIIESGVRYYDARLINTR